MAFDYQTLKNLVSSSFISNTITGSDVGDLQVSSAKILNSTVTATQLGDSSINLASGTVTGSVTTARG